MAWNMDEKLLCKILREKEIKFDEIPDDFDIESLPDDVEIIFEEHFPELENEFWDDNDCIPHILLE